MDECYRLFLEPTNAYRGKPFWAWNGKLEKEELLRQIHIMKEMGFGGFFMHSRTGLNTQYLGDEWFDLIRACTNEAVQLGMEPWIYDEDRWPSGSAGGIVTQTPQYRRKYLTLYLGKQPAAQGELIAVFRGRVNGFDLSSGYERIDPADAASIQLDEDEVFLSFCVRSMRCQSVFNGYTDLDRLNLEATQEFIRVTHEQYRSKCGEAFAHICGVFTDEPTHGPVFSDFGDAGSELCWSVPWTEGLERDFCAAYGEDLLSRLPELFLRLNGAPIAKIKWQYMELIEQLFIDRFLKPIQQWCRENKLCFTGHFVNEDSLMSQTVALGSMLRCYAYLDNPGMDCLTDCRYIPWAAKVLESAARQNGQKWKLTELYGATGWHMRFQDYKYVGDWHAVLGINVRCHHLSWYTMQGEAKRDYPGTFLHQATWYQEHELLESYFARLGVVASQGSPLCSTLVLHPVESLWGQIHPEWANCLDAKDEIIQKLEKKFIQLFTWLSESHVDFDYGDEAVLAEKAQIVQADGRCYLQLGQMRYERMLVSGCMSIRESTLRLLEAFQNAGGELLFLGKAPEYIDCEKDVRCKKLARVSKHLPFNRKALLDDFANVEMPLRIENAADGKYLYLQLRRCADGVFAILWNHSRKRSLKRVQFQINGFEAAQRWDCFTGLRDALPIQNGRLWLDFAPGQEQVLFLTHAAAQMPASAKSIASHVQYPLIKVRSYDLDERNVFVLDAAKLWVDDALLSERDEMLNLDRRLRQHIGLEARGGEMLQPWAVQDSDRTLAALRMQIRFDVEKIPDQPVYLALEPMKNMHISINGRKNALAETNLFWVDRCFKLYQIAQDVLLLGRNELEISADYTETSGLESMYLLGDFGVYCRRGRYIIDALPAGINIGNLIHQGFPFYGGKIRYHLDIPHAAMFSDLSLALPEIGGSCAIADYAGNAQMIPWPWQEAKWQGDGNTQELTIQLVLNRRNIFGPLHRFPLKQPYVAPDSFVCQDLDRYSLIPTGLLKPPVLALKSKEK